MDKKELKNIFQFLDNSEYSIDQDIINNHCTDWRISVNMQHQKQKLLN